MTNKKIKYFKQTTKKKKDKMINPKKKISEKNKLKNKYLKYQEKNL